MNRLAKILFSLSLPVLILSCSTPTGCLRENSFTQTIPAILSFPDEKPVLYRAEFEVLKYKFSGLIAFREMPELSETRISFISEMGIKIMEFRRTPAGVENTYCMPAIYRKSVVKFVGLFLEMVLHTPGDAICCNDDSSPSVMKSCKAGREKILISAYEEEKKHRQFSTSKKKKISALYSQSENIPDTIWVTMKYNTNIEMNLVNNAFK